MSGQSGAPAASVNLVGSTLAGRYRLTQLLGQGGMGTVYKAQDTAMSDRVVAVKVLAPHLVSDERQVMRFEQEARAANQLRHPNTISVLDFGRDSAGHIFMVIEFLTGETLTAILRRGRLSMSRCLYIFRQVCKSLAEAHSRNIVHRDLKPDNIFVCEIYGESDFVKVIDFGIAKFLEDENAQLTQAGKMFGTPRYLSPEQASGGKLDNRSDLYALGVIMFECITGRPPFIAAEPIAVAIKHVQEPAPRMEEVINDINIPEEIDGLVFRLLQKRPEDRFQSAEEVVVAIDGAMSALQRQGVSLPLGQYTPHAAMTPVKATTIPPMSSEQPTRAIDLNETKATAADDATRAMDSLSAVHDDATRAMDSLSVVHDDATRALDTLRPGMIAEAAAATMALDTVDALKALEKSKRASQTLPAAQDVAPAAPQRSKTPMVIGVLLLIAALVGGGLFWRSHQAEQEAQRSALAAKAKKAQKAAEDAKKRAKEQEAQRKAELAKAHEAKEAAERQAAAEKARLQKQVKDLEQHQVKIVTVPPGATVLEGTKTLGVTPLTLTLKRVDATKTLTIRRAAHKDATVALEPAKVVVTADKTLKVLLEKKPMAPKKPKPAGGGKNKKLDWGM